IPIAGIGIGAVIDVVAHRHQAKVFSDSVPLDPAGLASDLPASLARLPVMGRSGDYVVPDAVASRADGRRRAAGSAGGSRAAANCIPVFRPRVWLCMGCELGV